MGKGAIVKLAVPAVFEDVLGVELIPEVEDAIRAGFRGVEIVLRALEGGELFDGKVFRELFDGEAGKIVRHLMCFWRVDRVPFNPVSFIADCSSSVGW